MSLKPEIEAALKAHAFWHKNFTDFLAGRTSVDLDKIDSDIDCDFGRWLAHDGSHHIPEPLYHQIRAAHADFHHVAAAIVRHIKAKEFATAHELVAPDGALDRAGTTLVGLLIRIPLQDAADAPAGEHGEPGIDDLSP